MIRIKLHGRLGNQMFQYAFGYALSLKYSCFLDLDESIEANQLHKYFSIKENNKLVKYLFNKKTFNSSITQSGTDNPEEFLALCTNNKYYQGFFQSELYFEKYKSKIIKSFKIKDDFKDLFKQKYSAITGGKKIIGIHIRRTDYLVQGVDMFGGKDLSLPSTYYMNCLKQIDLQNYIIFVVGDDIEYAKRIFSHLNNCIIKENNEITDFQILMNSDIVCIANSSFSWWAAYLNKKPDKIIYAPKYWMGFRVKKEYPVSIIPHDWIQIDV